MISEDNDDMAGCYFDRSPLAVYSAGLKFKKQFHIFITETMIYGA